MDQDDKKHNRLKQSQRPTQTPERKWSDKDILAAKDNKEVMTAYQNARKDRFADVGSLQFTVGERLTQLGDVENGMKFTLLGEQTRNTDRLGQITEAFYAGTEKIGHQAERFNEPVEMFGRQISRLEEATEAMRGIPSRMLDAADNMGNAIRRIEEPIQSLDYSSRRISSAAEQIEASSYRMGSGR